MDKVGTYCFIGRMHCDFLYSYSPNSADVDQAKSVRYRIRNNGGGSESSLRSFPFNCRGYSVNSA